MVSYLKDGLEIGVVCPTSTVHTYHSQHDCSKNRESLDILLDSVVLAWKIAGPHRIDDFS